ncbi:hypothetical protein SNK05_007396 [Fusarium graminearum]
MDSNHWKLIPASRREIFDLEDIDKRPIVSSMLLCVPVSTRSPSSTSIQFRDVEGNVASIVGLAMWMESYGPRWGTLIVRFVIRDCPFPGPLLANFQFPLRDAQTSRCTNLLDVINPLRGVPGEELDDESRFDLTQFRFCPFSDDIRGYRDVL